MSLQKGYETKMDQMNAQLSGGERRRIDIARILIMNPDIFSSPVIIKRLL